jgi:hypothetical protein
MSSKRRTLISILQKKTKLSLGRIKALAPLFCIFWEKEKLFWKRIKLLTQSEENVMAKALAIIGILFCRYGATGFHFLFECSMFVFNKEQFEKNLKVLNYKTKMEFKNLETS